MSKHADILAKSVAVYDAVVDKHGISSRATLCDDPQRQYLRFYEIVKFLDLNDSKKALLDVGCGNGELYKFLNFLGYRGQYIGYDINEKLIAQAQSRFANINFQKKDIMNEEIKQRYDYVVLSGLFNVNVGQTKDWVYGFMRKMFELCTDVTVFNMISTYVTFLEEHMFYMNPAETLTFCIENLSKRTTLTHHNLPYNYTVCVFRNESWNSVKDMSQ